MRVGVIGAGAIGGTIAALLDRGGHDVAVTARGEHLAALRSSGLRLSGGFGDHIARVDAAPTLADRPELAVLAVKAPDAAAALRQNADALAGTPLLVVQNGLDGLAVAAREAPTSPLAGGLSLLAAQHLRLGEIAVTAALPTILGRPAGGSPEPLEAFARLLGAVMPIERLPGDIAGAQWTKLLINHVNALPAITGWSVQETVADPRTRRVLVASMRESVRIAHAAGIRFAPMRGLDDRLLSLVALLPTGIGGFLPRRMAAAMGEVPNYGSTLQSIRRGRPTEIDALNGAVVRVASEHGLAAPVNAALTAMVHEVETTGAFLDPDDVGARIPE